MANDALQACRQPAAKPLGSKPGPCFRRRHPDQKRAQLQKLVQHLERLWDHYGVPEWHRKLYTERYCTGGYRPELLLKEAKALVAGDALVQKAQAAIDAREDLLIRLSLLRLAFSDEEFRQPSSAARMQLSEHLNDLRLATVEAVHILAEWKHFVAPATGLTSVAGPSTRGACWPCNIDAESWPDYLLCIARDDRLVRSFGHILEVSEDPDPLLMHSAVGGVGPGQTGKLCPPSFDGVAIGRLEKARLILIEEELALAVFTQQLQRTLPCTERPPSSMSLNRSSAVQCADRLPSSTSDAGVSDLKASPISSSPQVQVRVPSSMSDVRGGSPISDGPGASGASSTASTACTPVLQPASEKLPCSDKLSPLTVDVTFDRSTSPVGDLPVEHPSSEQSRHRMSHLLLALSKPLELPPLPSQQDSKAQGMQHLRSGSMLARHGSMLRPSIIARQTSAASSGGAEHRGSINRRRSAQSRRGSDMARVPKRRSSLTKADETGIMQPKPCSTQGRLQGLSFARQTSNAESSARKGDGLHGDDEERREKLKAPPATVDVNRVHSAWHRFESDGMLHHDDMSMALSRVGFVRPQASWVDNAFTQVTLFNGVSKDEFIAVIHVYDAMQRQDLKEKFSKYDDGDGEMQADEFAELLASFGIEPMSHVLEECIDEVDADGSGSLNFEEFYKVMSLLSIREGFSVSEYSHLETIFRKFDKYQKLEIEVRELWQILIYLGISVSYEDCKMVSGTVDLDGSGNIDFQEFLMCMRIFRDKELDALKKDISLFEGDVAGSVNISALPILLQRRQYFADEDVILEVLTEIGFPLKDLYNPESVSLDISTLWRFLVIYRSREGLSRAEAASLRKVFQQHSSRSEATQEREVTMAELPRVLRVIGYNLAIEDQKQLAAQVDIDRSGAIGCAELMKLIRMCHEKRSNQIQAAYHSKSPSTWRKSTQSGDEDRGIISITAMEKLKVLGCMRKDVEFPPPALLSEIDGDGRIKLLEFMRVARRMDEQVRLELHQSGGYTMDEMDELKAKFRKYDKDGGGSIEKQELIMLITDVFPDMATDAAKRPQLLFMLQNADTDGDGELDFEEFLKLMRLVEDLRHQMQLDKEKQAIAETAFASSEVNEFRDIFLSAAYDTNTRSTPCISLTDFKVMIAPVCPMGEKNSQRVDEIWLEVKRQKSDCADFAEFLWVMHKLINSELYARMKFPKQ